MKTIHRKSNKIVTKSTVKEAFFAAYEQYPDNTAIYENKNGVYEPISYRRLYTEINALGTYFASIGLIGKHFMLVGENSADWCRSYLTVVCGCGIIIPVDCETKPEELCNLRLLSDSEVVLYSKKCEENVKKAFENSENKPELICFSDYADYIVKGNELIFEENTDYKNVNISKDDTACIFFTSGTTSVAKGVMLSQGNITFDISEISLVLKHSDEDIFFAALPLHHAYTCTCSFLFPLCTGASVAICRGLKYISKDMKLIKPTIICCVPALVETFYKKIKATIARRGAAAVKTSEKLAQITGDDIKLKKFLFKEIHDSFGGRLRLIISGGAHCDPEIIHGMRKYGFFTIQGYGLTECAPLAAVNRDEMHHDGSAGLATPNGIIDIYDKRKDGTGEIRYKGGNVMQGYYKNPEATAEVLRDGWFYTGDLGYLDKDGFLFITGRQKNLIVTNGGKNIFPEELETQLCRNAFVNEAVVISYPNESTGDLDIVAVIYPDEAQLKAKYGRDFTKGQVDAELEEAIDEVNARNVRYKHIKYFVTRSTPFDYNSSHKVLRAKIPGEAREAYLKKLSGSQNM